MEKILKDSISAAHEAGNIIMKYYKTKLEIKHKSVNNPVTKADLAANKIIKKNLISKYPNFGWLSEETKDSEHRLSNEYVWIIDPIDGTKEFIEGISNFAISIGLVKNQKPILGVLYNPATEELFYGSKNNGSFYNGKKCQISTLKNIEKVKIVVSRSEIKAGLWEKFSFKQESKIEIGSVAYKLGLIAANKYDFFATLKPKNEWDICAGHIIIQEAGGVLKNIHDFTTPTYNQKLTLQKPGLVGGNADISSTFSRIWKDKFQKLR